MVGNSVDEISFHLRLIGLTPDESVGFCKSIPETDFELRRMPNGLVNVSLEIKEGFSRNLACEAVQACGLQGKVDIFISIVATNDSGIKDVPRLVTEVICRLQCGLTVSYTLIP
jgi:hypothetical protein